MSGHFKSCGSLVPWCTLLRHATLQKPWQRNVYIASSICFRFSNCGISFKGSRSRSSRPSHPYIRPQGEINHDVLVTGNLKKLKVWEFYVKSYLQRTQLYSRVPEKSVRQLVHFPPRNVNTQSVSAFSAIAITVLRKWDVFHALKSRFSFKSFVNL